MRWRIVSVILSSILEKKRKEKRQKAVLTWLVVFCSGHCLLQDKIWPADQRGKSVVLAARPTQKRSLKKIRTHFTRHSYPLWLTKHCISGSQPDPNSQSCGPAGLTFVLASADTEMLVPDCVDTQGLTLTFQGDGRSQLLDGHNRHLPTMFFSEGQGLC